MKFNFPDFLLQCCVGFIIAIFTFSLEVQSQKVDKSHEFDFMLFAQVWPISGCIEWEERSQHNSCTLPNRKTWTVHGIWPSRNFSMGPFHCNNSAKFNEDLIKPILPDLRLHWTNVRENSPEDQFWKHEWEKHGTCAMVLDPLSTELKFFEKGLELNKVYPLSDILAKNGITPGGIYETELIVEALKKHFGGLNPAIECKKEKDIKNHVLYQISVCLDKQFNVIDCEVAHGGVYGQCPRNGALEYPKDEILFHGHSVGAIIGGILLALIVVLICAYIIRRLYLDATRLRGYESL